MGLRNSYVVCFALMLTLSSSINALDITKILGAYPEFSTFNKYVTETKLAEQINGAKAITVLGLDNEALACLAGKPLDAIKTVIGTHIIKEYYDEKKMVDAIGAHTQLATFSQPIYANLIGEGEVAFASAAPGSAYDTKMVRAVSNQPETVSILQVTQPIVPVPVLPTSSPAAPSTVAEAPKTIVNVVDGKAAAAPAPGPSSSSSRIQMGVFGAVIAFASLFVSL